jgi:hypothetical protein
VNLTAGIGNSHLTWLAIVYVRQSTVAQARQNTESTQRQYGSVGTAAELGWLAEQIVVVDADLGVSGRDAERDGYRQIMARICTGEVGAVFGLEVLRFGRSNADLTRLMELVRLTDAAHRHRRRARHGQRQRPDPAWLRGPDERDRTAFPARPAARGETRRGHRGELRHPLPVGFVYDEDNTAVTDPDEQVQAAVTDLCPEFGRTGASGRLFSHRAWGGM